MKALSKKAIELSLNNNRIMGAFMVMYDRHYETIKRWLLSNDPRFTGPRAVQVIIEETGLTIAEIIDQPKKKGS